MTKLRIASLLSAFLMTLSTAVAAPASRHAKLVKSEPAASDTLRASPPSLKLWFSESVELGITRVKLTDAAGGVVKTGALTRDGGTADQPVVTMIETALSAGTYTVTWNAAGKDGHASSGSFAFTIRPAR